MSEKRRSVRTYDGRLISDEDRAGIEAFCAGLSNPFGIPVEFMFLDPAEHGLKSPVLAGETLYLAGKIRREEHFEEAFGYSFEAVLMYAWSIGVGSVWIGGTFNREAFEKAVMLGDGELMPCASPLGYAAESMSLREKMMRKGIKADTRYEPGRLFFDGEYGRAFDLGDGAADALTARALESVRWAPSAVNKQPWRIVLTEGRAHFYEKPDKGYCSEAHGDLQRIDIGIALYHFMHEYEAAGRTVRLVCEDPHRHVPDGVQYAATVIMD
ncbi:MAG: nitroreductase [Lachnospiraceae bacterium]|nr:nitroreductase [Lachnospiraceae bacterium]